MTITKAAKRFAWKSIELLYALKTNRQAAYFHALAPFS
jgi:hypothetical protein